MDTSTIWEESNVEYLANSEFLQLPKSNHYCPSWSNYPIPIVSASGGLLETNVIICGGVLKDTGNNEIDGFPTNNCYLLNSYQKKPKFLTNMISERYDAASAVIDGTYLWISGGLGCIWSKDWSCINIILSSSEFINLDGPIEGPELPIQLYGHRMINKENSLTIVIGGSTSYEECGSFCISEETFYYDHSKETWSDGPQMQQERHWHAVGIVIDEVTKERLVVVTGGYGQDGSALTSTEILLHDQWIAGVKK